MNIREQTQQLELQYLSKYAAFSKNTRGREKQLPPCNLRTEFQRDRDKIIHCKAFRRLKHKTQVFIAPEGDHYRTRLTHTLEVSQIARTAARALRLNEDLVEAIALGHDLGHTPFGHAGERVLNDVCPHGFKHYEHSLRVVDVLEGDGGLNLTHEVRDGIATHATGGNASTLEGQLIKYADRIAYINHDIDDAIRAGLLQFEHLPKSCINILGDTHSKRINTLICALVDDSMDKGSISMNGEIESQMNILREFMFDHVYFNAVAKAEEQKVEVIITALYNYFVKNPEIIPNDYEKGDVDRAACDYIASMTDRYAIHIFNKLFIPSRWNVL